MWIDRRLVPGLYEYDLIVFSSRALLRVEATPLATSWGQRMLTSSTAPAHASSILSVTVDDSVEAEFSDSVRTGGMYRGLLRRHLAFADRKAADASSIAARMEGTSKDGRRPKAASRK